MPPMRRVTEEDCEEDRDLGTRVSPVVSCSNDPTDTGNAAPVVPVLSLV